MNKKLMPILGLVFGLAIVLAALAAFQSAGYNVDNFARDFLGINAHIHHDFWSLFLMAPFGLLYCKYRKQWMLLLFFIGLGMFAHHIVSEGPVFISPLK